MKVMNWYKMAQINKEFIIMRGVPGSGKSFKAKQIAGTSGVVNSADDYFMEKGKGSYAFDPSLLGAAHKQCQDRTAKALEQGKTPVIIDNTNTTKKELSQLKPIIEYAKSLGYSIRIEEPDTQWWKERNVDEFEKKNTHKVPREAIERMVNRFVPDITVDNILSDNF